MKKNKELKVELDDLWGEGEEVLIFSCNEEFIKKFTEIANKRFASSVNLLKDLNLLHIRLQRSEYNTFYLDIDPIFNELDEILTKIKDKDINEELKIYFVISKKNSSKLEEHDLPKNIITLILKGKEVLDIEGRKYTY